MAETIRIADLATLIAEEIGNFLKWNIHPDNDKNFDCLMKEYHFDGADEASKRTHPTDLVISYTDPYENQKIYFNTDLKSYDTNSIKYSNVKDWLAKITQGTVCSCASSEWKNRYGIEGRYDIRGLLFVYNHDGKFDVPFYSFIHDYPNPPSTGRKAPSRFHLKDLNVPTNIKIHIIEPNLIDSILSIKHDINVLRTEKKIPQNDEEAPIFFYYPNRQRFKNRIRPEECPATIELISGPFFIMNYDNYTTFKINPKDLKNPEIIQKNRGNIIYYKESGETVDEFIYLLETLMMYDLIHENCDTKIRHCSRIISSNAKQNFISAIERYCALWDYSEGMKTIFNEIEFNKVTIVQKIFCDKQVDKV